MTISWHVDDLKVSHKSPKVVTEFIEWVKKEYGKEREVTFTRGCKHAYLGMLLDYSRKGKVIIDMTSYVKDMWEEFPQELDGQVRTPATKHLYEIKPSKRLDKKTGEIFHTFVAKALFLTKRGRPDVMPTVSFLCTRVKESTKQDWDKLVRMVTFLKNTQDQVLTLEADNTTTCRWSVDSAFAVHGNMRSHSGKPWDGSRSPRMAEQQRPECHSWIK